jgi:chromate reductase, NAD(P)H dehydrogenase (quinone)
MNAPEAYIQFKQGLITPEGDVTVPATKEFLRKYMEDLHAFITRVYVALPRDA